jgi:hypothetical protein
MIAVANRKYSRVRKEETGSTKTKTGIKIGNFRGSMHFVIHNNAKILATISVLLEDQMHGFYGLKMNSGYQ